MIGIGIIGYGYWGPNLVRNFAQVPGTRVVGVCDLRLERLAQVQQQYPLTRITSNHHDLLGDPTIHAVAIATPVSSHFDLAMQALRAGKHVLVEKPLTANVEQAERLIDEAEQRGRVLMVDHTFIYTSAVRKMKQLVDEGRIGTIYYYDSVRVNLGLFQSDVNVLWDLAVHDLSIMDYVLGATPAAVAATGMAHIPGRPENMAYLTCFFPHDLIAHFHVNWLAPVKIRRTLIGGSKQMIVYDDLEPSEKIKVYDKGVTVNGTPDGLYELMVGYRSGDMWAPRLEPREALHTEAQHFIQCIERGERPISDGQAGLRVVRVLEAAGQSLLRRGQPVELAGGRIL